MLKFRAGHPGTGKDGAGRRRDGEGMGQEPEVGQRSSFTKDAHGIPAWGSHRAGGPAGVVVWSAWSRRSLHV